MEKISSEEGFDGTNALELLSGNQKKYLLSHGRDNERLVPKKYEGHDDFADGFTIN
jgi:hypothetical protein